MLLHRARVLGGDREVNAHHPGPVPDVPARLQQVLGNGSAAVVRVTMKRHKTLGQRGVAHCVGVEETVEDFAEASGPAQRLKPLALPFQGSVQLRVEREAFEPDHELP